MVQLLQALVEIQQTWEVPHLSSWSQQALTYSPSLVQEDLHILPPSWEEVLSLRSPGLEEPSRQQGAGVEGALSLDLMIGGGANGLATSAGSSPGKIQRFNFYEKKKNIYEDLSNFSML
jgi:hypothetical protein